MTSITISLVGNPNCGKSTLFNQLTGARQRVGNWPGVTVECKSGYYNFEEQKTNVMDLPGIYQLSWSKNTQAIDEKIACEYLLHNSSDVIVNIIDATHLERHLYLTLQLLTMGVPLIVVVNMMDVAKRRNIEIKLDILQQRLGCPVVGAIANKGMGITDLKNKIASQNLHKPNSLIVDYPACLKQALTLLVAKIKSHHQELSHQATWLAQQVLMGNDLPQPLHPDILETASRFKKELEQELNEELDIIFADVFYTEAHQINQAATTQKSQQKTLTEKIDKIVLNRFLGIPIFLLAMYGMFLFAINLGGAFQDFFDIASDALFVQGTTQYLAQLHAPGWLIAVLAAGFGRGINTTVTFIPVIGAMFLFLAFLESSGYMARASFVIDRLMRMIGLPGKSFVPMIIGFGCNVPAILAARTLENPRDRILTILMSPFMSCGARLAIFAVFTAAFFPTGGQNIVFALYLIGISAAILTGFLLRKTLLQGDLTPLILELPTYHMPSLPTLLMQTWLRLKSFIFSAGRLIIPICMLIGVLNAINVDGSLNQKTSSSTSLLASVGKVVTPILSPMGIKEDNWPATVGLVTGILAKEVVVATLNTLYTQEGNLSSQEGTPSSLLNRLKESILSIPANLMALKDSFSNPILAGAPDHTLSHRVYGIMYQRFSGQVAAFAYLLFVLLYFPCISATAVMAKELNKKWTLFSVAWSTYLAYSIATCFYQIATFGMHSKQSLIYILTTLLIFAGIISIMKRHSMKNLQQVAQKCC
jgi:ferrous iron transport protein B